MAQVFWSNLYIAGVHFKTTYQIKFKNNALICLFVSVHEIFFCWTVADANLDEIYTYGKLTCKILILSMFKTRLDTGNCPGRGDYKNAI